MDRKSRLVFLISLVIVFLILAFLAVHVALDTHEQHLLIMTEPENTTENGTVAYEDMTDDEQTVFREALEREDGRAKIPDRVDPEIWIENRAVIYQNRTYGAGVESE